MRLSIIAVALVLLAGCTPAPQMPADEHEIVRKLDDFSAKYEQTQNGVQQDAIAVSQAKFIKSHMVGRVARNWVGTLKSIDSMFGTVFVKITLSDAVTVEQQFDQKAPFVKKLAALRVGSTVRFSGQITHEGSLTSSGRTENPEFYIKLASIREQ